MELIILWAIFAIIGYVIDGGRGLVLGLLIGIFGNIISVILKVAGK